MFLCILYVILGWKTRFCFFFLQKVSLFHNQNDANKLKRNVFSKTAIESAKKHWNPANTVFAVKISAKKTLKAQKKHLNCADLSIFFPKITAKMLQTSWNYMFFTRSRRNLSKNSKIRQKCTIFAEFFR